MRSSWSRHPSGSTSAPTPGRSRPRSAPPSPLRGRSRRRRRGGDQAARRRRTPSTYPGRLATLNPPRLGERLERGRSRPVGASAVSVSYVSATATIRAIAGSSAPAARPDSRARPSAGGCVADLADRARDPGVRAGSHGRLGVAADRVPSRPGARTVALEARSASASLPMWCGDQAVCASFLVAARHASPSRRYHARLRRRPPHAAPHGRRVGRDVRMSAEQVPPRARRTVPCAAPQAVTTRRAIYVKATISRTRRHSPRRRSARSPLRPRA